MDEAIVIPLYRVRWCTRAVLEGLQHHYAPQAIHVICPESQTTKLLQSAEGWRVESLHVHPEEPFFTRRFGIDKTSIGEGLDLARSLYTAGWYYQQLLKLGAHDGIEGLPKDYLVWDSDLLPVASWPVIIPERKPYPHTFALLQDKSRGNADIIARWERWIRSILNVEPVTDPEGTFVPHHLWFNRAVSEEIKGALHHYYDSSEPWPLLMMRSANEFGTFSEFWLYCSWLARHHPDRLNYHSYERYGATTERFFDDGTGRFSGKLRSFLGRDEASPDYTSVIRFIEAEYGEANLPSSLSFESSPRHMKKGVGNMHVEELRSRWHLAEPGSSA